MRLSYPGPILTDSRYISEVSSTLERQEAFFDEHVVNICKAHKIFVLEGRSQSKFMNGEGVSLIYFWSSDVSH